MYAFSSLMEVACLTIAAILLLWVAVNDYRHFVIPNKTVAAISLLYPCYVLAAGLGADPSGWLGGIATGGAVLLVGAGLFATGAFGGGDAKLIAAVALWAGPSLLVQFLLITAISGGVLAAAFLIAKSVAKPAGDSAVFEGGSADNIPYGVAISTGGLFVCLQLLAG